MVGLLHPDVIQTSNAFYDKLKESRDDRLSYGAVLRNILSMSDSEVELTTKIAKLTHISLDEEYAQIKVTEPLVGDEDIEQVFEVEGTIYDISSVNTDGKKY
jgi:hypothetical protein